MLSQRYFYVNAAYFSSIVRFCTDICPETNAFLKWIFVDNQLFMILAQLLTI